jgi:hypothetical protein
MLSWRESVGGIAKAAILISEKLECSLSKAEKLASGRYDREISASEERELSSLTGIDREALFRVANKSGAKAS